MGMNGHKGQLQAQPTNNYNNASPTYAESSNFKKMINAKNINIVYALLAINREINCFSYKILLHTCLFDPEHKQKEF